MDRRQFLTSLAAVATVAALPIPAESIERWTRSGAFRGQTFVFRRPLVIDAAYLTDDLEFVDCTFIADHDEEKNAFSFFWAEGQPRVSLYNCTFQWPPTRPGPAPRWLFHECELING